MTGAAFAYDNAKPAGLDQWPLIASLHAPDDVKRLDARERLELAAEIRDFLIDHVSATGGHLGVNLGVVELTIALHTVFSSPDDAILFDTGHQCYVHKIITGRAARFGSLRRAGGLSGYPSRAESEHDWIESSHASSSLAYADGLAKGFRLQGETDRRVVAVTGDGGLTGGLAWEGLNNIVANGSRVVIIVNDNGRSYAPTVGGLCRQGTGDEPSRMAVGDTFRALGFEYVGPIDGHDLGALNIALTAAAEASSPVVVHCVTVKGKGYEAAERDARDRMHAIGTIDPTTGRPAAPPQPTWTGEFSREIVRLASQRPDLVAITAAMLDPVGLTPFAENFPERVFDVGIAEQHAVTSAAGLAMSGLHPVVCLYSTFLSRAIDQVLMDVALHRLPVTFVVDRAGITGPDGASHHGMWDTALCTAIPGVRIAAPRDAPRLRELLADAIGCDGPTVVRYPRASVSGGDPTDRAHRRHRRPPRQPTQLSRGADHLSWPARVGMHLCRKASRNERSVSYRHRPPMDTADQPRIALHGSTLRTRRHCRGRRARRRNGHSAPARLLGRRDIHPMSSPRAQ